MPDFPYCFHRCKVDFALSCHVLVHIIRIYHGCEAGLDKSFLRITVTLWQQKAWHRLPEVPENAEMQYYKMMSH